MTVLDGVQVAAIALLGLLVIGLLKSHAEILRQLHELGAGRAEENGHPVPVDLARGGADGATAHDLAGRTPAGEAAVVAVRGVGHDTLLAFLSSGCLTCAGFWEALGAGANLGLPAHMRVVAVTKDPGEESASAIREVSSGATVVMSTQAWFDYEVPGSPYFVHVSAATGRVSGEGTASTWEQVVSLVSRAAADARRSRVGASVQVESGHGDHIDHELTAAGILPGDPSLHPTAPPGDDVAGA
jgi:hypothetical protein